MPTYQYFCDACALDFEASKSFTDPSEQHCPQCAGVARKVFAPVGVHFKGTGFYRTDSRSAGSSGESSSSASSSTAKE